MKYIKKLPEENQTVLKEKVKILKESGEHEKPKNGLENMTENKEKGIKFSPNSGYPSLRLTK